MVRSWILILFGFTIASLAQEDNGWLINISERFLVSHLMENSLSKIVFFYEENTPLGHEILALAQRFSTSGRGWFVATVPVGSSANAPRLQQRYFRRSTVILISCAERSTTRLLRMASLLIGVEAASVDWLLLLGASGDVPASAMHTVRPDAQVSLVRLDPGGTARLSWWTGAAFVEAPKKRKRSLRGLHLSVAIFHDPPFVDIRSDGNSSVASGWFVDMWTELKKSLQFTSNFYMPRRRADEQERVRIASEELASGRADVVLAPFAMTTRTFEVAEFSVPVATLKQRLFIHRSSAVSGVGQFLQPFSTHLWGGVMGLTTFSAVLMGVAYTVARRFGLEVHQAPLFELRESFLIIFSSLLQQGTDNSPTATSGRMILWCSYAFGLIIYTAYSAALISKLTVREVDYPFQSLDQMLQASSYRPVLLKDSPLHHLIKEADVGAWRTLRERRPAVMVADNVDAAIALLMDSEERLVLLEAHERVGPLVQVEPLNCEILAMPGAEPLPVGLMLQKSSPLKTALDQEILLMWETGRLDRVRRRWMHLVKEDSCPLDSSLPSFTLSNVKLPFFIFASGAVLALVVLAVENLVYYAHKK